VTARENPSALKNMELGTRKASYKWDEDTEDERQKPR
jgi:hypothetical protein